MIMCYYGCGKKATYQFKNGKWCCSNSHNKCPELKKSNKQKNQNKIFSEEHIKNLKISRKNRKMKKWSLSQKENLSLKRQGTQNSMFGKNHNEETKKKIGLKSLGRKHSEEFKEKLRNKMINGGHSYISSFIKKISKEEKILREMVKELYSNCISV